jgi:glucose-6-phosphate dehydrogenase assembly protein OpcA
MNIDLPNTTTRNIEEALTRARHRLGGPAVGLVLTLVIVTDEAAQYDALRAATEVGREHPSRIVAVIVRDRAAAARVDAEIRVGDIGPGETILLRLHGPLVDYAESVVTPLLVSDAPVVTWWPGTPPDVPAERPLGALAQRRVTDAAAAPDPRGTLYRLIASQRPGDTDFAWTRLTPWRSVLAAALDQPHGEPIAAEVAAEPDNTSAELLGAWLSDRLEIPVSRPDSAGPGITLVRLTTTEGDIVLTRPDGRVATLSQPGQPDRRLVLSRRPIGELLAEELRRLDPDEIYQETVRRLVREPLTAAPGEGSGGA